MAIAVFHSTRNHPQTNASPNAYPELQALIPKDQPESTHPVQRAIANGLVERERFEPTDHDSRWLRTRIVSIKESDRKMRVVEVWEMNHELQRATCLSRELFLADQLLVRNHSTENLEQLNDILEDGNLSFGNKIAKNVYTLISGRQGLDAIPDAIRYLSDYPEIVDTVEGDGFGFGGGDPNDSRFDEQWGLKNTGQNGGTPGADVNATEFWRILTNTPDVTVAVLDSGLNFDHPDLQGISWINPGETDADGIDNDSNGWVDDVHGWDFVNDDNGPRDDHGHGSNVTGIIAANRNNGTGIAGMLSDAKILSCKILNSNNVGSTSNFIAGVQYAREQGASVMNLSLQNYPYSSLLNDECSRCESQGIILSICAGNQGEDNDSSPNYPSSYTHANIISVANHDRTDVRWSGSFNPSNYGKDSVDLFAPGRRVLSPILNSSYSAYTGASQAAPFVTSVCIAIKQANPSWKAPDIKSAILDTVVTKESYGGICQTSGRLDSAAALAQSIILGEENDSDKDGYSNRFELLAGSRLDLSDHLPAIDLEVAPGLLSISIPREQRDDLIFEAEKSFDLVSWISMGIVDTSTPQEFKNQISAPSEGQVFLRVRTVMVP